MSSACCRSLVVPWTSSRLRAVSTLIAPGRDMKFSAALRRHRDESFVRPWL